MIYRVRATIRGRRITSKSWWRKRANAQAYADATNKNFFKANARVVECK